MDKTLTITFASVILASLGIAIYASIARQWGVIPGLLIAAGIAVWMIIIEVKKARKKDGE